MTVRWVRWGRAFIKQARYSDSASARTESAERSLATHMYLTEMSKQQSRHSCIPELGRIEALLNNSVGGFPHSDVDTFGLIVTRPRAW